MKKPTLTLRARRQVTLTIVEEFFDEPSLNDEPYTVLVRKIEALAKREQITEAFAERVIFGLMQYGEQDE